MTLSRSGPYPDGMAWRCIRGDCPYTCEDDGPDLCPVHHGPLMRTMGVFYLNELEAQCPPQAPPP